MLRTSSCCNKTFMTAPLFTRPIGKGTRVRVYPNNNDVRNVN